jgi:hypothetical protein
MALGRDLVDVEVESRSGSKYVFPDVPRAMLDNVIQLKGWEAVGRIILVNVSTAVLSLPPGLTKTLSYDGKVQWKAEG